MQPEVFSARLGDTFIMEIAMTLGMTKKYLQDLNKIKKHMRFILISDLVILDVKKIEENIEAGISR